MDDVVNTRVVRGHHLAELGREDLDLYGVEELRERVQGLRDEIDRVESQIKRKHSSQAAAESLFKPRPD